MAHTRKRHVLGLVKQALSFSSVVGVLGHRQVGKTTFLSDNYAHYFSLDDEDNLRKARKSAKQFIALLKSGASAKVTAVIDECQACETLFPTIKEWVRVHKRPAQFLLSGSVRFTSKRAIRESLTGRIVNIELLPMTVSELGELKKPSGLLEILKASRIVPSLLIDPAKEATSREATHLIDSYLIKGGLPGLCFLRNNRMRQQRALEQLETILDRDLRTIYETPMSFARLRSYLEALSKEDGQKVGLTELFRASGVSMRSQPFLLYALEALFLIRLLPIEGDRRGQAVFFEDQYEVNLLSKQSLNTEVQWAGFVYRNCREQFFYEQGYNFSFFQFRTRAGSVVPFAISSDHGILGFIPCLLEPSRAQMAAARSFLARYSNSKLLFVTRGNSTEVFDDRTAVVPANVILFK